MHKKVLLLLATFTTLMIPTMAQAGSLQNVIQITCSKQLNYFSLHTFEVQDRDDFWNAEKAIEHESQGFFSAQSLLGHPYKCDTGEAIISVEITNYQPPRERGECGGVEYFNLLIRQNDNEIYKFAPYPSGNACLNPSTHFIEMLEPANKYSLKDCEIPNRQDQTFCSYPTNKK